MLSKIEQNLLKATTGIHEVPQGAYSLRINGKLEGANSSENIEIVKKEDKPGIDIYIKDGTKNESMHLPVLLSSTGLKELVYNDFHVGKDCDVTIVAGCGIHNGGENDSEHSGVHSFYVGKNSKLKYIEKHYGDGDGTGKRLMNPATHIELEENSYMEMETAQIKGVDNTVRTTTAVIADGATLVVGEKIMTHNDQYAETRFEVDLKGKDSGAHVVSRSVARDDSKQLFLSKICGNNASVSAVPEILANHVDAQLIHEAAIGKIAGEQLIKLMTLGLTEKEAEEEIINGFLK